MFEHPLRLKHRSNNFLIFRLTPSHQCTMVQRMRLTINLDDDLYAMARTHALLQRTSISKAVGDLLRRRVSGGADTARTGAAPDADFRIDPETQLPVVRGRGTALTNEDVQQATEDDDIRHGALPGTGTIPPRQ
ncbi:MAG: type II toxin-antitoxin system VapB family antitoxin [Akkermansiaceae bacterium]|nr:type II toxin-antitoxin system VapB family antitoxin [Akkermansiaceae bacterium]MCF7731416.1 type II toxin-antitoxin system VapB family antitoxin [Akkermansiaceae bacterium]